MPEESFVGKPITCKAAVCWEVNKPLVIETITVDPPKEGEVRYKVLSTGLCHSDLNFWKGLFPIPVGPIILGHEGVGQVESVGSAVTDFEIGDYVIPLYASQCGKCQYCEVKSINLCEKEIAFGNDTMDDGTTRFSVDGKAVYHMANCSTFSQYSVSPQRALVKINSEAPMDKICLLGCCIPTGYGAATKIAKVTNESTCAVFGLGAVGLAAVMGCKKAGASRIIGVDVNPDKSAKGKQFGCTDFVNPKDHEKPIQEVLRGMTNGAGLDYTFECVGDSLCAAAVLESCKKGSGTAVMVGIVDPKQSVPGTALLSLLLGRKWLGAINGGYKSKEELPELVKLCMDGELMLDEFITHTMPLEKINEAFELLIDGKSIRTVLLPWDKEETV